MISHTSFLSFLVFVPAPVFSWVHKVHVAFGDMAYNLMSSDAKSKIDYLVSPVFSKVVDDSTKVNMIQEYGQNGVLGVSEFAAMNIMPDVFQKLTLGEYFIKFGGRIPENLIEFSLVVEENLHSMNNAFPDICCMKNIPNIDRLLPELESAAGDIKLSDSTRAAALLFFSHLVADLHQPLHVLSRVDSNCNYDRGGNKFCLHREENGECLKKNRLHKYWDANSLSIDVDNIKAKYPCSAFEHDQVHDFSIKTWVDEALAHAPFIYSIPEDIGVPDAYVRAAREIVEERVTLGACRVIEMLEDVVDL